MPAIYYVRHGLTDWNVQQRLQGRRDVPLNTEGCGQAIRCGEILRDLFSATAARRKTSPTCRARSSARARPWS